MATLRSKEMDRKYRAVLAGRTKDDPCALCREEPIRQFEHWKIIRNDFPYDRIAERHDLLVPLRHVTENGITPEEWAEYAHIKHTFVRDEYEYLTEGMPRTQSIPEHYHIHLIVVRREWPD